MCRSRSYIAALAYAIVLTLIALMLGGCTLPSLDGRSVSKALSPEQANTTALGRSLEPQLIAHPGLTGVYPLADPHDAFAARMLLARTAERTLDVQYYIWQADMTGTLLLEALHQAANRGVRVRLLLDDNGTAGLDSALAALGHHPNIEVRLFNPFVIRTPKFIGYLTDFRRLNRRMHNKSFTADNQATIVGGRNIGDAYFGATQDVLFADLDVLAIGPAVQEVSADFDRYWSSDSAYPATRMLPAVAPEKLAQLERAASSVERDPRAAFYIQTLKQSAFISQLLRGDLPLEWTIVRMVSDDPAKALARARPQAMVAHQLQEIIGKPQKNVELISPYFVPTASGAEALATLVQQGIRVRVLTNALEATDVAVVHSGYAKRRRDLLQNGIELWEMRRSVSTATHNPKLGIFGSSASSLHAKTFSVDDARVFVGSFNFDPRSAHLNTELGFVIDSPTLARRIRDTFDNRIPAQAYRVCLTENARDLYWLEQVNDQWVRHETEPGTQAWQRFSVWFLSLLPIEPML